MVGTMTSLSEFTPTFVDCENFKVEALANQLVNITAYQKFPKNTMEVDNAVENEFGTVVFLITVFPSKSAEFCFTKQASK